MKIPTLYEESCINHYVFTEELL